MTPETSDNEADDTERCRVCELPLDMDNTHPIDNSLGWCGNCGEYRSPSLYTGTKQMTENGGDV